MTQTENKGTSNVIQIEISQVETMYSRETKIFVSVLDSDHNYGDIILVNPIKKKWNAGVTALKTSFLKRKLYNAIGHNT